MEHTKAKSGYNVNYVDNGRSYSDICREHNIALGTLEYWMKSSVSVAGSEGHGVVHEEWRNPGILRWPCTT